MLAAKLASVVVMFLATLLSQQGWTKILVAMNRMHLAPCHSCLLKRCAVVLPLPESPRCPLFWTPNALDGLECTMHAQEL